MTLPVYIYGQQVLRKVAQDIPLDYPNLKELIQNMFETMEASDGIGLAAPQIGLDIRLLVVDLDVLAETYPEYKVIERPLSIPISLRLTNNRQPRAWKKDVSRCLAYTKRLRDTPASACNMLTKTFNRTTNGLRVI